MKLNRTPIVASALAIVATLAIGGLTGCGSDASGENSAAIGTLASANGASDLSGTWVYNKDLSDHPRRPDSGGRPDSWHRPDSTDRPAGWRRPGGHGGRGPHPDSLGNGGPMRGPMTLVIEQTDSTVEITGGRGRTRVLYPDGRVITHTRGDEGKTIEVTASWDSEDRLVVVGTGPRGGTHTETFSLSADGQRLFIDKTFDPASDRESRSFRRVFDAAPSGN